MVSWDDSLRHPACRFMNADDGIMRLHQSEIPGPDALNTNPRGLLQRLHLRGSLENPFRRCGEPLFLRACHYIEEAETKPAADEEATEVPLSHIPAPGVPKSDPGDSDYDDV